MKINDCKKILQKLGNYNTAKKLKDDFQDRVIFLVRFL